MPSTEIKTATAQACAPAPDSLSSAVPGGHKPAIIAVRKRCEAEGIGLSHYVLMDRKAGK